MDQLTDRQAAIFEYICDYQQKFSRSPSNREIGARFNINSPNGVLCHLHAMERKGYIRRPANLSRAIEIVRKPKSSGVPASVVGETLNKFGFGQALAEVLRECAVIR